MREKWFEVSSDKLDIQGVEIKFDSVKVTESIPNFLEIKLLDRGTPHTKTTVTVYYQNIYVETGNLRFKVSRDFVIELYLLLRDCTRCPLDFITEEGQEFIKEQ